MAKPKPFQYDTLLRIRRRQEDLRAQALATTQRDIRAAEAQRDELNEQRRRTLDRAGEAVKTKFNAGDVRRYYQYERYLAHLASETDAKIAQLRREADKRRAELDSAMKRRRVIEKLKERREEAFQTEMNKDQQKMIDEAATIRAALARGAGGGQSIGRETP
ncbi:MAG: Flagellar FliJ protein [Candidatus Hydrogenedentes bacterium]|nr:Flagellar FliJ protein [Candidatus Hydrogenedentota bacterium]